MKNEYKDIFEDGSEYNALSKALHECANDYNQHIYDYMEQTPKASFVVHLVDKLNEIGFKITPNQPQ